MTPAVRPAEDRDRFAEDRGGTVLAANRHRPGGRAMSYIDESLVRSHQRRLLTDADAYARARRLRAARKWARRAEWTARRAARASAAVR